VYNHLSVYNNEKIDKKCNKNGSHREKCYENGMKVINADKEIERNTLPYEVIFRRLQYTWRKVKNTTTTNQKPPSAAMSSQ